MEISGRKEFSLKRREYDFRLVQPGSVDGQPVNFDFEWKIEAFNPAFDLLGSMGRAVIQNQMKNFNSFRPETTKDHQEEPLEINETLALQKADHRFPVMNQKRGEEIGNPLPQIPGADPKAVSAACRRNAAGVSQSLNAGFLISADNRLSALGQLLGPLVEIQNNGGSLQKSGVSRFLPGLMLPGFDFLLAKPFSYGRWGNA